MDIKYLLIIFQFVIIVMLLGVNDANLTLKDELYLKLQEHHEDHCNADGWQVPKADWTLDDLYNPSGALWF